MKKLKEILKLQNIGILFGIGVIFSGIILLILPGSSLTTVCYILGVGVAAKGLVKLIDYVKAKQNGTEKTKDLISIIFVLFAAFALILHPVKLISIIPSFIGFGVIVYGIVAFLKPGGLFSKVISVIAVIIGAGIMGAPFAFAETVTSFLGFALIIVGVIVTIKAKETITLKTENKDDNGYTEVEFKDIN